MELMSSSTRLYILAGVLFLVGLGLGLSINRFIKPGSNINLTSNNTQKDGLSKLLTTQTATIKGKVLKVEGKLLTVQNSSGLTGDVLLSDNAVVSKVNKNGTFASPSADLSIIEPNQEAIITLAYTGGVYKATLIQFLPPLPPAPKFQATKSATQSR